MGAGMGAVAPELYTRTAGRMRTNKTGWQNWAGKTALAEKPQVFALELASIPCSKSTASAPNSHGTRDPRPILTSLSSHHILPAARRCQPWSPFSPVAETGQFVPQYA